MLLKGEKKKKQIVPTWTTNYVCTVKQEQIMVLDEHVFSCVARLYKAEVCVCLFVLMMRTEEASGKK